MFAIVSEINKILQLKLQLYLCVALATALKRNMHVFEWHIHILEFVVSKHGLELVL